MEISYRMIRTDRRTVAIQISPNGEVLVRCPSRMSEKAVRSFVESKSDWIAKHLARQMGVRYGRVTIRSQHTRWGSCSGKGNLNFNCLLMLTPPEIRDYVVVHELCHLRQMNHSAQFWAEVERVLPDYRVARKWLKDNGRSLIGRLPQ